MIELLERTFPGVLYQTGIRRGRDGEWQAFVGATRSDNGIHAGSKVEFVSVWCRDIESLPAELLKKAREKIRLWYAEALKDVTEKSEELDRLRRELERRAAVWTELDERSADVAGVSPQPINADDI